MFLIATPAVMLVVNSVFANGVNGAYRQRRRLILTNPALWPGEMRRLDRFSGFAYLAVASSRIASTSMRVFG